jgi:RloB-like protein
VSPDKIRSARPQRGKSLTSKPRLRRPREIIYVVAEGEVTEYQYCAALSNTFAERFGFRIDIPTPHVRRNGLTPIEVAEHALTVAASTRSEQRGTAPGPPSPIREVWALFDRDQHPRIPEVFAKLAGHKRIRVAFSHPSFDLWLLLHFTAVSDAQEGSSEQVHSRLRNCPGFAGFGSHEKRITDPSTDVWRLIECLGIPDVLT